MDVSHVVKKNMEYHFFKNLPINNGHFGAKRISLKEWFVNKWKTLMDNAKSELTTTSGAKVDGFKMGKCLGFCILKWHNIESSTNWLCGLTYACCNHF